VTVLPCVRWRLDVDNRAVDNDLAEINDVLRLQRQRGVSDPLLVAGEIAPAVKSRGRSRHDTAVGACIDDGCDSGRHRPPPFSDSLATCSADTTSICLILGDAFPIGGASHHDRSRPKGEHPARALVPPSVPPFGAAAFDAHSQIGHDCSHIGYGQESRPPEA
jgi:hypothetical protein